MTKTTCIRERFFFYLLFRLITTWHGKKLYILTQIVPKWKRNKTYNITLYINSFWFDKFFHSLNHVSPVFMIAWTRSKHDYTWTHTYTKKVYRFVSSTRINWNEPTREKNKESKWIYILTHEKKIMCTQNKFHLTCNMRRWWLSNPNIVLVCVSVITTDLMAYRWDRWRWW